MSDEHSKMKSLVSEEERKKLVREISSIKDILDSFKYGLNFEQFADELFRTVENQTIVMKRLESKMHQIEDRMNTLEATLKEGIKVRLTSENGDLKKLESSEFIIGEDNQSEELIEEQELQDADRSEIQRQSKQISTKIAMLFEKENELLEMALNDPAGADEYEKKAAVAREMRQELETKLENIQTMLTE
ncbi:hypothetical protein EU537_07110 [Candidatus Thorarchaeota archaeon]|nr:MAG: hypothetical protein EU537_07110 [Candidatus Thorarchaeota archaeon]